MNLKERKLKNLVEKELKRNKNTNSNVQFSMDLSNSINKEPKVSRKLKTEKIIPENSDKNIFQKFSRLILNHKIISILLLFIVALGSVYYRKIAELRKSNLDIGIFDIVKTGLNALADSDKNALKELNQQNGRTNIILIGIDKREETSSLLTDSIMLVSYDHATNQALQMSFPRDLYLDYDINGLTYGSKINAVFTYAYNASEADTELGKYTDAFAKLGEVLEEITGLKVNYGAMVNFNGLKDIIDNLGGVSVDVENSFTDCIFPNDNDVSAQEAYQSKIDTGCDKLVGAPSYPNYPNDEGYMAISYEKGVQQMDGASALRYARSRHSFQNSEGTDFARARRQQKIIAAIKEKAMGADFIKKLTNLNEITALIGNNLQFYNIGGKELDSFIRSRELLQSLTFNSMVVDPDIGSYTNQLLTGRTWDQHDGAYMILPNYRNYSGDYTEVHELIKFYLNNLFLVSEASEVYLAYSDASRYTEYANLKSILLDKMLKFDSTSGDYMIKYTPVLPSTQTISPTEEGSETSSGKLFILNDGNTQTAEFYKKLFLENEVNLEIKDKSELSEDFLQEFEGQDIIILLD